MKESRILNKIENAMLNFASEITEDYLLFASNEEEPEADERDFDLESFLEMGDVHCLYVAV